MLSSVLLNCSLLVNNTIHCQIFLDTKVYRAYERNSTNRFVRAIVRGITPFTNNDLRKFTNQHQLGVRMSDWIIIRTNLLLRSGSMSRNVLFLHLRKTCSALCVAFDYKVSTSQTFLTTSVAQQCKSLSRHYTAKQ
jgi:hypothetical protein